MPLRGFTQTLDRIVKAAAISFLVVLALLGCGREPAHALVGHWKSDEARTLLELDLAKTGGRLSEWSEEREAFYRAGFFGRLEIFIEANRSKAWFPDESPDDVPWSAHSLHDLGEARILLESKDEETGEPYRREFRVQPGGQCYVVEQPALGFAEWFCRVGSP